MTATKIGELQKTNVTAACEYKAHLSHLHSTFLISSSISLYRSSQACNLRILMLFKHSEVLRMRSSFAAISLSW